MDPASLSPADRVFEVEVIPLGRADEVAGAILSANLQEFLGLPAVVSPPWPVPDYAHIPARNQYDAGLILQHFYKDLPPDGLRLGLTALDLTLPILTYVFGEALVGGRVAVVSIFRLGREPGHPRKDLGLLYERLVKVGLHETAHALGVPHCRQSGCLMRFSYGLEHLDALEPQFCSSCRQALAEFLKQ